MHELKGIPNSEVPYYLNASNVLLLTSLQEGSPTIVKEALACDLPVVSVNVGDVQERIEGIEGCYLASSDPGDISAKLRLVRFGAQRVSGHVTVRELSVENVALRVKELYEDCWKISQRIG